MKMRKNLFALLFGSDSDSNKQSPLRLRLESLEVRQMLSATPIETAPCADETADAALVAPLATSADDEEIDFDLDDEDPDWDLGDEDPDLQAEIVTINLADYDSYSTYVLKDDGLYGQKKVGKEIEEELIDVDAEFADAGVVVINGQTKVTENLIVDSTAWDYFQVIEFNGGSGSKDSISITTSEDDENISIYKETIKQEVPVYTSNPYAKTMENYAKKIEKAYEDGKDDLAEKYENLWQKYADKWEKLQEKTKTVTTTYSSVGSFEEIVDIEVNEKTGKEKEVVSREFFSIVRFTGVKNVTVDAGDGFDSYEIVSLGTAYTLAGGELLDFTEAAKTVNFDISKTSKQTAISGDSGTIALKDKVDAFVFKGKQNITVRGDGDYTVVLENGDKSTFNAGSLGKDGSLTIMGDGDNVTVNGGKGSVFMGGEDEYFVGDKVALNCTSTVVVEAYIEGDGVRVNSGKGEDFVSVVGDSAVINTNKGDDFVEVVGGDAHINLGAGSDVAVVSDRYDEDGEKRVGKVGKNYVYGGEDDDFINLANASGKNYLYANGGNDVLIGGVGNDYLYGNSGKNVLFGLAGADHIYGSSKADVMVANKTSNYEDFDVDFYDAVYEAWVKDGDVEATMDLLGDGEADDAKDYLYTSKRSGDLVAANEGDDDFIGGGVDADGDEWIYLKK